MHDSKISFPNHKLKRSVRRDMELEMERWLRHEKNSFLPEPSDYKITITQDGTDPYFYCHIEAEIGPCKWSSHESGRTVTMAFTRALRLMRPTRTLRRSTNSSDAHVA